MYSRPQGGFNKGSSLNQNTSGGFLFGSILNPSSNQPKSPIFGSSGGLFGASLTQQNQPLTQSFMNPLPSTQSSQPQNIFGGTPSFMSANRGSGFSGGLFCPKAESKPSLFGTGQTSLKPTLGGIFSPTTNTPQSVFGNQSNQIFSTAKPAIFGGFGTRKGTVNFNDMSSVYQKKDNMEVKCITATKEFNSKSIDEWRIEDYYLMKNNEISSQNMERLKRAWAINEKFQRQHSPGFNFESKVPEKVPFFAATTYQKPNIAMSTSSSKPSSIFGAFQNQTTSSLFSATPILTTTQTQKPSISSGNIFGNKPISTGLFGQKTTVFQAPSQAAPSQNLFSQSGASSLFSQPRSNITKPVIQQKPSLTSLSEAKVSFGFQPTPGFNQNVQPVQSQFSGVQFSAPQFEKNIPELATEEEVSQVADTFSLFGDKIRIKKLDDLPSDENDQNQSLFSKVMQKNEIQPFSVSSRITEKDPFGEDIGQIPEKIDKGRVPVENSLLFALTRGPSKQRFRKHPHPEDEDITKEIDREKKSRRMRKLEKPIKKIKTNSDDASSLSSSYGARKINSIITFDDDASESVTIESAPLMSIQDLKSIVLRKSSQGENIDPKDVSVFCNDENVDETLLVNKLKPEALNKLELHVNKKKQKILADKNLLPKVPSELLISPLKSELEKMTEEELSHVKNFSVCNQHGKIKFLEPVDLRSIDLGKTILLSHKSVEIYPKSMNQAIPNVGSGLNHPAMIEFYNWQLPQKFLSQLGKYEAKLKHWAESIHAEFVDYDPVKQQVSIKVQKFSD